MKVKSDKKRELILQVAKNEFLNLGFKDASLRNIAQKINGTTGTIYTYFKNKDEIFRALVNPVIIWFENRFNQAENATDEEIREGLNSMDISYSTWLNRGYRLFIGLTEQYRDELNLLFFKSNGSLLESFKEDITQRATDRGIRIFRNFKRTSEFQGEVVSEFFIRNFASFNINLMREMIKQNKSKEEMLIMEKEFTQFLYNGWKALVDI